MAAVAMVALAAVIACGNRDARPEPARPAPPAAEKPGHSSGEELFPAEKFDEIQTFFARKRRVATRCFIQALEQGELAPRSAGYITLSMTILESGATSDVAIAEATLQSNHLDECLLGHVRRWIVTSLPRPLQYTYTFAFDTL